MGSGAGVGGYEVEVTQLANSAQRTFTFTSPSSEETLTIDGQELKLKAGESAKTLASQINSSSKSTVYAAVLEDGTIVLSNRATGNTGSEFIKVTDTGGSLTEVAGTAKEGKNAEFTVDGGGRHVHLQHRHQRDRRGHADPRRPHSGRAR